TDSTLKMNSAKNPKYKIIIQGDWNEFNEMKTGFGRDEYYKKLYSQKRYTKCENALRSFVQNPIDLKFNNHILITLNGMSFQPQSLY
ncbi:MAG: hypothetical protein ABI855_04780, partial [Bacteroidota bacterium]